MIQDTWLPSRPTRFVAVADNHGIMQDDRSVEALFDFIDDTKPKIRLHLGDGFDFSALRRGADEKDECADLKEDWDAGAAFARRFFRGGERNVYLEGNHCGKRLRALLGHPRAILRDYGERAVEDFERLIKKQCRAIMLPYDSRLGVYKLGHLNVLHGFHHGIGATKAHATHYRNCIHGHTHTVESVTVPNLDGPAEGRAIGALCRLDMPYNAHQTNKLRHSNGWAYGVLNPDGTYHLFQAIKIKDHFYAAENIKKY